MCGAMMGSMGMSGDAWLVPVLLTLTVLAGAIAATVAVAAARPPRAPAVASGEPAGLSVVKERYARGEIDHQELDRILDRLLRAQRPDRR